MQIAGAFVRIVLAIFAFGASLSSLRELTIVCQTTGHQELLIGPITLCLATVYLIYRFIWRAPKAARHDKEKPSKYAGKGVLALVSLLLVAAVVRSGMQAGAEAQTGLSGLALQYVEQANLARGLVDEVLALMIVFLVYVGRRVLLRRTSRARAAGVS